MVTESSDSQLVVEQFFNGDLFLVANECCIANGDLMWAKANEINVRE